MRYEPGQHNTLLYLFVVIAEVKACCSTDDIILRVRTSIHIIQRLPHPSFLPPSLVFPSILPSQLVHRDSRGQSPDIIFPADSRCHSLTLKKKNKSSSAGGFSSSSFSHMLFLFRFLALSVSCRFLPLRLCLSHTLDCESTVVRVR